MLLFFADVAEPQFSAKEVVPKVSSASQQQSAAEQLRIVADLRKQLLLQQMENAKIENEILQMKRERLTKKIKAESAGGLSYMQLP